MVHGAPDVRPVEILVRDNTILVKIIKAEKISDEQELIKNINEVLYAEPNLIEQSTNNPNIYNFILGKIMKKTHGRADPQLTIKLIKKEIEDKN